MTDTAQEAAQEATTSSIASKECIVSGMYQWLYSALHHLGAHIEKNGMISDREDEILAIGSLFLAEAKSSGLIDENMKFSDSLVIAPLEDPSLPLVRTALPDAIVHAGIAVIDQKKEDNRNYVPGVTTDWDDGMVSIAIYRAMTRAMRTGTYKCRLATDDRGTFAEVLGVSTVDAAKNHALSLFHACRGDWMGGTISVLRAAIPEDLDPDMFMEFFSTPYEVSIEFVNEDPVAVVRRKIDEDQSDA